MPSIKLKITQPIAQKCVHDEAPGTLIMDSEVPGLRLVVGAKSASWKLVASINDGTNRGITMTLGRSDALTVIQARREALELKLRLGRGEDPRRKAEPKVMSMAEALERYIETRPHLAAKTVHFYRSMVEGPLKDLASLPLDKLTREQVRGLHERVTRKSGPGMANGAMRVAKAMINDVLRDTDLPYGNVVARAVRFNRIEARDWAVGPDELPKLWSKLEQMENRALAIAWEVALCTGLRCGDLRSMRWSDIDDQGVLNVPCPKGGKAKAFDLPLTKHVLSKLDELKEITRPWDSDFCFPARSKSGHMEVMRRTKDWPWPAHAMRHTYRTVAMEAGVPTDTVKLLMNHQSGGVSWGYVTRANLLGPMREAAEVVAAKLLEHRGS